MKYLVDKEANIEAKGFRGWTALHYASLAGGKQKYFWTKYTK